MAYYKFTGNTTTNYPLLGINATPGSVYDLDPNVIAGLDSNWVATSGPTTVVSNPTVLGVGQQIGDLSATYASTALPAGLVGNKARYEPRLNLYNFSGSNTQHLRAALAAAKAGAGYARIALVGDSTTAGYKILPTSAATWPVVLRGLLPGAGLPVAGTGPVIANPDGTAGSVIDGRWTFAGGTWTSQSNNENHLKQAPALNATATFASDVAGTIVEIAYLDTGDGFTYAIDGGAAVTVTPGSTATMKSVVVTGLANTTHSVVLTAKGVNYWAIWVDVRSASGVLLGNFGLNGSRVSDWNNTTSYFAGPLVNAWAPHCTLVNLSINDAGGSVSASSYQTALQGIITRHLGTGDVILVNAVPTQGVNKDAYRQVQYNLADSNGLPLLDLADRWGNAFATMNTLGMYATGDSTHPNATGAADIARAHLAALLAA